jgi:hypothetical protein
VAALAGLTLMNLTVAGLIATAISYWLSIMLAIQLLGPWMNRQPLAVALSAPLWVSAELL